MLLQHWKHFLNKTQQNQVLFFDPFANSEFPCAVLLWYMEILHRFPETQLLSTVQCSATKSGNRISMSLYFLNCYKSLSSLRKDESHVSSVSWCFKVRILYLFCMHGAAHLISCLYFKDFFKLKYFSTLSFSSLTHWLSSEQQDTWQRGAKQIGCVYVLRFLPCCRFVALAVAAPKQCPLYLRRIPCHSHSPILTHPNHQQSQIHKVTWSGTYTLYMCKQGSDLSLPALLYSCKLSSWK